MKAIVSALLLSAVSATASYSTVSGGPTWTVTYTNSKFKFDIANVPSGATFILAFGNNAASTATDLAVFSAAGNGVLTDKFGTFSSSSTSGDTNSWTNFGSTSANGMYTFTA